MTNDIPVFARWGFGWGTAMFDVYLNDRHDLLVVRKGFPIPVGSGRWRKRRKKKAESVSEEIRSAVQNQGYYLRKLKELKSGAGRP